MISTLLAILVVMLLFLLRQPADVKIVQNGAPPLLQVSAPAQDPMPDDVKAWLKHLQRIEDEKNDLELKQSADMEVFGQMAKTLGPGMGGMDPFDQEGGGDKEPSDLTKGKFQDLKPAWDSLIRDFQSVKPPSECEEIADNYYAGLSEIPGTISDLQDVLNQVQSDPQAALVKAQQMQSRSYRTIDSKFAESDKGVQALCDKYHVKKWFNIGERSMLFGKSDLGSLSP